MIQEYSQPDYLQAMGIQGWRLRTSEALNENIFWGYSILNQEGRPRLWLIAEIISSEEQALFSAIVKALSPDSLPAVELATLPKADGNCTLVILGNHLAARLKSLADSNGFQGVIIGGSLEELLKQPSLKAELWKQLKPLK